MDYDSVKPAATSWEDAPASDMTRREYVAAVVLQGLCSTDGMAAMDDAEHAKAAVSLADALLARLDPTRDQD